METMCNFAGINIPEQMPDFNSPGNVGSWRQLLAANVGRAVRLEISVQLNGTLRSICGTIYAVGNAYVALVNNGQVIIADILALKFAYFE